MSLCDNDDLGCDSGPLEGLTSRGTRLLSRDRLSIWTRNSTHSIQEVRDSRLTCC